MIKLKGLLLTLLLFFMNNCGITTNEITPEKALQDTIEKIEADKEAKPHIYYINIDKSGSKGTSNVNHEFQVFLEVIVKYFTKPGDQIVVIHTYENSSSIGNFHRYEIKTPYPDVSEITDFEQKMRIVMGYFQTIKKEKQQIIAKIKKKHFDTPADAPQSEILSSLYRIAEDMKYYGDTREYRLLALTDAIEQSLIRSFGTPTPSEARAQGQEDAQKLADLYSISKDAFKNLEHIRFELPSDTIRDVNRNLNFVKEYWDEVFLYFGCSVVPDFTKANQ